MPAHDGTVDAACPTVVETPTIAGVTEACGGKVFADAGELAGPSTAGTGAPCIESRDGTAARLRLSSDASRYATGSAPPGRWIGLTEREDYQW